MTRHICAFPGCEARLAGHNVHNLCIEHLHTRGLCRCERCTKPRPLRAEHKDRPDVRQVLVTTAPAFSTCVEQRAARVSLPKEPWESIGDLAASLVEKAVRK